jgi:acetyl-CoA carboxylase beta subunit
MWVKDPDSGQMVFYKDLEANQYVMPQSGYHMRMPPDVRLRSMFDDGAYEKIAMPQVTPDPLKFRDERRYADRIKEARTKNGVDDCIQAGTGELEPIIAAAKLEDPLDPAQWMVCSVGGDTLYASAPCDGKARAYQLDAGGKIIGKHESKKTKNKHSKS